MAPWTQDEGPLFNTTVSVILTRFLLADALLEAGMRAHGQDWVEVAKFVPNRNNKACRKVCLWFGWGTRDITY